MRTIYGLFEYILKIFSGRYIFTPGTPRRVDDIFGPAYPSPSRKPSTEPFADTAVGEIVKDRQLGALYVDKYHIISYNYDIL